MVKTIFFILTIFCLKYAILTDQCISGNYNEKIYEFCSPENSLAILNSLYFFIYFEIVGIMKKI